MSNKTQAEKFHYRCGIVCWSCPAFEMRPSYEGEDADGDCKRMKMPVKKEYTCDKHPDWRKVHEGHKEGKKQ